jgi:hypothetical protein
MGQYFIIVNPAKRQYLDAGGFGMSNKRSFLMQGIPGFAVGLLICDDIDDRGPTGLLGSWVGDPIIAAGDDYGIPNPGGILTSSESEPNRNLNQLAHTEYEDITQRVIAMLAHYSGGDAEELAEFGMVCDEGLLRLGQVVFALNCQPLKDALDRLEPRWPSRYKKILDEKGYLLS